MYVKFKKNIFKIYLKTQGRQGGGEAQEEVNARKCLEYLEYPILRFTMKM